MLEVLRHTPHWVYTAFTVVLYLGLSACFENRIAVQRLFHLPTVFILLSVGGIVLHNGFSVAVLSVWAFGFVLAGTLIYRLTLIAPDGFRREADVLVIPGDVGILLASLFFFAVKFWLGYTSATDPAWAQQMTFQSWDSLASGVVVGFFGGRGLAHFLIAKRLGLEAGLEGRHGTR